MNLYFRNKMKTEQKLLNFFMKQVTRNPISLKGSKCISEDGKQGIFFTNPVR